MIYNRTVEKRRKIADKALGVISFGAVVLALSCLGILLILIVGVALPGLKQSYLKLPVEFNQEHVEKGKYRKILNDSLDGMLDFLGSDLKRREFSKIISKHSSHIIKSYVQANPVVIGKKVEVDVPLSDIWDQVNKNILDASVMFQHRDVSKDLYSVFLDLRSSELVEFQWNIGVLTNTNSRFPELAGLYGAFVGSFYAMIICFLISFPISVATVIYLEEFAVKGRFSDFIELNINNLAAVPSIVFGLLGLAFFIGVLGFPRSSPFVGGLVLALMSMPSMVIAGKEAVRRVPLTLREASLALGASKQQTVFHHVVPNAMPGILTGTIIALAQALGETAPLLLIGMNAFVTSDPGGIMSPATSLPTQIFIWSDSPERGFIARTGIAIIVLIVFLVVMNGISIFIRMRSSKNDDY